MSESHATPPAGPPATSRPDDRPRPVRAGRQARSPTARNASSSTTPSTSSTRPSGVCLRTSVTPRVPSSNPWSTAGRGVTTSSCGPTASSDCALTSTSCSGASPRTWPASRTCSPSSTARVLGAYLTQPYSYLALQKRSQYVNRIEGSGHGLEMLPGQGKYLFVYPFVKTRAWYNLSPHARQGMMDEHINAVGPVQGRAHQHQLQLRHRRPGIRCRVRLRLPAGVRRPRRAPALHGGAACTRCGTRRCSPAPRPISRPSSRSSHDRG